ncbi:YeeE/YedE family protein [Roseibium sp. CAU 1637]|uniref:YeeE/YedE family protein n=1 Tax=Roseibium limicola TaxID=2816037 RepID=A0A939EQ89_9HYPH|nr:YeeE/YedE thiosulfate transporter family protein [Roseibium limicola]MBO0346528.1 YeeE/YedE family protein [Roseibium limicola]
MPRSTGSSRRTAWEEVSHNQNATSPGGAVVHCSTGSRRAAKRCDAWPQRRGQGVGAQVLVHLLTSAISFPLIARGGDVGLRVNRFFFPFGVAVALGALMLEIGMQFGGGCASGTQRTGC